MKRIKTLITALLIAATAFAATTAESVLDKTVKKLTTAPTVRITFTLRSGSESTGGAMTLAKNKFLLDSPEMGIWFDGKTQWTYAKGQKEVNITLPTAEELQMINPITVLNGFKSNFNAMLLKDDKGKLTVKLTPKKKGGEIDAAVVAINPATDFPESVVLTLSNRTTVCIKINSINTGAKLNDASFRFNKANYPDVEVIDLR